MNDNKTIITAELCEKIVRKCLRGENSETLGVTVVDLPNKNFIINVTDGNKENTLSLFAKTYSKIPKIQEILEEIQKIVPKFNPITPKLYFQDANLLFFGNLTWHGFQNASSFDLNHVKIVLKILAQLHAGSLAYEDFKSEEKGRKFTLEEKFVVKNTVVNMENSDVCELISSLVGEDKTLKTIKHLEQCQISSKFRRALCHGNLFLHNMMFKYQNLTPVECRLINFKNEPRYLPPIYDFLQVIFFNTKEEFRQHHFEDLLFYYHQSLVEESEKINTDQIQSIEDLKKQTHQFLPLIKLKVALIKQDDDSGRKLKETLSSSVLSREDCYNIIKKKIGSTDYKFISSEITSLDQASGYLGTYHKLKITFLQKSEETMYCFVKTMPKNSSARNIVEETGCFFKEVFVYQTLIPQMQNLDINMIDDCLPGCYFQRSEDVLVFDDLNVKKYQTLPSQISFGLDLLSLCVKKMAKLHASMLIFEEKKSMELKRSYRLGENYQEYLEEIFFTKEKNHSGAILMQTGVRSILDVINLFPEIKTDFNLKNFEKWWPKLQELFFSVIKPSTKYRNVLSHGDLWTNNIMVKFEGTKPIDCVFVDFQTIRWCPPAHDFLSVIYLTTDRATRLKHEEEMTLLYYKEVEEILKCYNLESEKILSFQEFIETIAYIRPQMVMQAIMYKSFILCTSEEISSFLGDDKISDYVFFENRERYLTQICEKSKVVAQALKECVLDLYDLCNNMSLM